jgi:hypothetical protein
MRPTSNDVESMNRLDVITQPIEGLATAEFSFNVASSLPSVREVAPWPWPSAPHITAHLAVATPQTPPDTTQEHAECETSGRG